MKYLETHSNDPYYNLSFEEYCFKYLPLEDEEYVFLWINAPSIIIGKNQNALQEINSDYVEEHDLKVCRRITGGGAVYHDLGNLNFSFVTKTKGSEKIDFKRYYTPIVNALRNIGVDAELSGRNDVVINEQKCVGASQSIWSGRVLSNGCILYDVRLEELAKALNVSKDKLESKGVKSVKARVTNVKPHLKEDKDILHFKKELLKQIFDNIGETPEEYVMSEKELEGVKEIYNNRFSRWDWNYGASPKATYANKERFSIGSIELSFNVKKGLIEDLKIHGDFFGTADVEKLEEKLTGVQYDKNKIIERLDGIDLAPFFGNITIDEFVELFFK